MARLLRAYPLGLDLPGIQPRGVMQIDWSHPISNGLSYVRVFNSWGDARALFNSNGNEGAFSIIAGSPTVAVAQSGIGLTGVGSIQYGAGGNSNYNAPQTKGTFVTQLTAGFSPTDGVKHLVAQMDGFFQILKDTDDNWYCGWLTGADYRVSTATSGTFAAGDSFSLALTYDTATNTKLYTKGVLRGTNATAPVPLPNAGGTMKWGGSSGAGGDTWNVSSKDAIYYVAFWSRVLSTDEIALLDADPYCFLTSAEGEMPALFTAAAAATQYAAFSTPQHSLSQVRNRMIGY